MRESTEELYEEINKHPENNTFTDKKNHGLYYGKMPGTENFPYLSP